MGMKASMQLFDDWRRRCPPKLSYRPKCPHPRNDRNHPSCRSTQ